jgi:hypothetical protein
MNAPLTIPIVAGRPGDQARVAQILTAHLEAERWCRRRRSWARLAFGLGFPMAYLLYSGGDAHHLAVSVVLWLWILTVISTGICVEGEASAEQRVSRLLAR